MFHYSPFSGFPIFHLSEVFLFFTFFSVSLFTFIGCFHFSPFWGVSIFHLSEVFPFFTFLRCFIFHHLRVFLCCYTASATDLRVLFLLLAVFYLTLFLHICQSTASATDLRELFLLSGISFLSLHSFSIFGTTCFYQGFPGSRQFFLEGCRASHWGLKHRPSPLVCLNHSVHQKTFNSCVRGC